MLNIKRNLLGWQQASAKEVMSSAWQKVRKLGLTLSEGLKQAWKEIKEFINGISSTYEEFKCTLNIKNNNKINKFEIKGEDMEELMENILEKIKEQKGNKFYFNFFAWFNKKWDSAINHLETKKKFTFSENQIWAVMQE